MVEGEIIYEEELPGDTRNKNNVQNDERDNTVRNIIIAVVILLILLCCCCSLFIAAIVASGIGEEIMRELNGALTLSTPYWLV